MTVKCLEDRLSDIYWNYIHKQGILLLLCVNDYSSMTLCMSAHTHTHTQTKNTHTHARMHTCTHTHKHYAEYTMHYTTHLHVHALHYTHVKDTTYCTCTHWHVPCHTQAHMLCQRHNTLHILHYTTWTWAWIADHLKDDVSLLQEQTESVNYCHQ